MKRAICGELMAVVQYSPGQEMWPSVWGVVLGEAPLESCNIWLSVC